ncbi:DUF1295-domain-containing protein [Stereum hirsutum FP-91666 SS1]|uniref:DUF1295-domain-containing protein n=1 Tax=Stereum hirsutum (strain FP-91666) TaxID=721885 RepID=UPI000440DC72|nr:DUF1295-domain-containing protein [Stereum hirsutum FP-91666 SS1]EIM91013.1 DUF1295-domain-containing protein [Stereum hirsutum FP-91666 SS1]
MNAFSRLIPVVGSAYGLQAALAAIFVPQANEKYYDLGGSLGFLSTAFVSLYYPQLKSSVLERRLVPLPALSSFAPRQLLLTAALGIWSARLGSFLVQRAIKAGGDSRFDEVKHQPAKFTAFWFAQATWVFLVGLPVYMVNTLPVHLHPALSYADYAAVGIYGASLLFEIIADRQKANWRNAQKNKQHEEKFITSGLWSLSRHPNYVGEVGIWTGIWALSIASLRTPYFPKLTWAVAAVSPLVTYMLLRNVSGVPPLEKSGDKKYGNDPKWQEYKRTVPVFWPWGGVD